MNNFFDNYNLSEIFIHIIPYIDFDNYHKLFFIQNKELTNLSFLYF